jgi:hypothetical protein
MDDKIEQIERGLDKDTAKAIAISDTVNGIKFAGMGEVMEFAKLMSLATGAVPPYLRGNPGACLAIAVQAIGWEMEPFSVANKSYFVNDRVAFEAQLIQSVINQRAPIKGRIKGEYSGNGGERQLTVWAILDEDGEKVEYTSPMKKDIGVQNSPLWKSDPDQQLWYYSTRAMCRRHFPDVLMGVYAKDELSDKPMRDVTPKASFTERLEAAQGGGEVVDGQPDEKELTAETEPLEPDLPPELEADVMSDEYTAGANCFNDGIVVADCPHEIGTQAAADWLGGWYMGKVAKGPDDAE